MKLHTPLLQTICVNLVRCRIQYACRASLHTTPACSQGGIQSSDEPIILVEQHGAVTMIGLNRPAKRNALNSNLITALRKELKLFESNQSSPVAVLYGTGGNLCAGIDLDDMPSEQQSIPLIDEYCSKPVVASIDGYTVGEGFDLAMACDLRVMDDHAVLGHFNRRFGVPTSVSALRRLSASVGFAFALEIVLHGRPIKAEEALQRGLVNQVVPCGSSRGNSYTFAQALTKFPQEALLADRAALYQSLNLSDGIQKAVDLERISALQEAQKRMQSETKRFAEGIGKHGTFKNLKVQSDLPEWMKT